MNNEKTGLDGRDMCILWPAFWPCPLPPSPGLNRKGQGNFLLYSCISDLDATPTVVSTVSGQPAECQYLKGHTGGELFQMPSFSNRSVRSMLPLLQTSCGRFLNISAWLEWGGKCKQGSALEPSGNFLPVQLTLPITLPWSLPLRQVPCSTDLFQCVS